MAAIHFRTVGFTFHHNEEEFAFRLYISRYKQDEAEKRGSESYITSSESCIAEANMPDSTRTAATTEDETWQVNTATPRRRRDLAKGKTGGRVNNNNKKKNQGASSFKSWSKPTTPKPMPKDEKNEPTGDGENTLVKAAGGVAAPVAADTSSSDNAGGFMMQPMSALLADYGDFDPNWMDKQPEVVETPVLVVDQKAPPETTASTNRHGQRGKAPLHIDIVSFGFRYGAPSTRRDGWSQTQPLPPFDCRDVLPQVPGYMQFHEGLSSGQVKRFLMYDFRRQTFRNRTSDTLEKDDDSDQVPSVRDYSIDTVAPQIYDALIEAVRTGGYGYAQPLNMQMFIGSEWGRHRAVVAVEQTASALRNLLRNCKDDDVLECPCSVATQHRDIERKIPSKQNREDDDD